MMRLRFAPMILALSSSGRPSSWSTKLTGSYMPSGCGKSDPNSTLSAPMSFTSPTGSSSWNGWTQMHRVNACIGSSSNAFGVRS
jgi:hypothetical protein